jgi:glycine/D-amino acid oxidase-like deaminating enzyme
MEEIRRKVSSGKAFGTRARLIEPAEIKEKFPLIEERQGAGRPVGPGCGPRHPALADGCRQAGRCMGVAAGKLQAFANTPAKSLVIENGRIRGVVTDRGTIDADYVVVCAGLWGRLIAEMAGEDLPVMPVDHPLTFFGPYTSSPAPARRSATRCCAIRATPPICATPATRRRRKAA